MRRCGPPDRAAAARPSPRRPWWASTPGVRMPTMTSSPDGDGGGRSPIRRRRSGRGRPLVGSTTAHSGNRRVLGWSTRRVPWRRCAGSSASAEGSHHLVSIERIRLRGNGDSAATLKSGASAALPYSSTVPTVIGQAASARRRRAAVGESPARLASASSTTHWDCSSSVASPTTLAIRISTSPTAVAVVRANSPARLQGKAPPLAR